MIVRVTPLAKSFKKLISYLRTGRDRLQREAERVAWIEFRNLPTRDPEVAACMMAATAGDSVTGTSTPVYHFSLSCPPDDPVDADMLRCIADRTIRDLGLTEYESIVFAHKDRSHPHLHFVVNRVHPERFTLWSNWWDYARIERSLRAQEQELGLRIVPGHLAPVHVREMEGLGQEERLVRLRPRPRLQRGDAAFVAAVAERAAPVLEQAESWAELERGLTEHGLSLRVKRGGMVFTDGRHEAKASAVGREFSRRNLEKEFGSYPDYRARVAAASALAPAVPVIRLGDEQPHAEPAEALPSPVSEKPAPTPQPRAHHRPQFGDAGHGIMELFGTPQPPAPEQPGRVVESRPAPGPQLESRETGFLREVKQRATAVFKGAQSWAELEQGLSDHGLSLRVKGGGFVVTDGEQEVKASEVGRPFSRFHLERRFGRYPEPSAPAFRPAPAAPQSDAVQPEAAPVLAAPVASPPTPAPEAIRPPAATEDTQLPIPFAEPSAPVAPPTPARAPTAPPQQLTLPLADPPVRPARPPTPTPAAPTVPPPTPDVPAPPPVERAPAPQPPSTPESPPAGRSQVQPIRPPTPRLVRQNPPTETDLYREAVWRMKVELARIYVDPTLARRGFDAHLASHGRAHAVRTLLENPETFGKLRLWATPERIADAARRADLYAHWQDGRLRPLRLAVAELLSAAETTAAATERAHTASDEYYAAADRYQHLKSRIGEAEFSEKEASDELPRVYRDPESARERIEAHYRLHGAGATVAEIRNAPWQFGKVTGQGWISRILDGPDVRGQRMRAESLARFYDMALVARERRPGPEVMARAESEMREAKRRMDAEHKRWTALPSRSPDGYVKEAARLVRRAAYARGAPVEHLLRRIGLRLPAGAARLALKVLEAVHKQERREHEREHRHRGPSIGL